MMKQREKNCAILKATREVIYSKRFTTNAPSWRCVPKQPVNEPGAHLEEITRDASVNCLEVASQICGIF